MFIPPQNIEIQQIYSRLLGKGKQSISISSASSGEGVTSVAIALAQHNLLAGHSTLLVDLNLHHPELDTLLDLEPNLSENQGLLDHPRLVCTQSNNAALTGVIAPNRRDLMMKLRKPGVLEQCIREWQETYDTVIIDTSPLNQFNSNNIPPERVAAACDGCVLIVLAGQSDENMVSSAVNALKSAEAELLGCVYNDRDNPSLKAELIRETKRLTPRFSHISLLDRKSVV